MKKNSHSSAQTFTHSSPRINTLVAALIAVGCASPVLAVDRTWFGGAGDWSVNANWSPVGVPVAGDLAIINGGTSTLSFAQVVAGLTLNGGTLAGIGNLTLSGSSTWNSGAQSGTGTTQFNGNLAISGDGNKFIGGSRGVNTAGTTT